MIKADIAFSDLACAAEWRNDAICMGQSQITPYLHPALETLLVRTEGQWFAVVRERLADVGGHEAARCETVDVERFNQLHRDALLWPLDYLMIEVAQEGCRLKLRAGVLGSAPVYCRVTGDRMSVSYDFADFLAQPSTIDPEIASRRLALHADYSARQICSGVLMLTERAVLYAEPGSVRHQYPSPVDPASPDERMEADRALAGFEQRLHRAVSARPAAAGRIVTELSGGMDSASVACALRSAHGQVTSVGILLDDEHSTTQARRRQLIVERLGLHDRTVDIAAFAPTLDLQPSVARREYPLAELYLEAFEGLWDKAQSQGCEWLFTGIGGDELFPLYRTETSSAGGETNEVMVQARRHAEKLLTPRALNAAQAISGMHAPASPVPTSTLGAIACQSPHLLRRGLWPVNPLGDPHLLAFCYRLPRQSRQDRETMRQYLQANLGDDVFTRNYAKETFAKVLPNVIAQQAKTIALQLRESALADLGLVDRSAVLALLDELVATRARALTAPLVSFLWLERFVRRVA